MHACDKKVALLGLSMETKGRIPHPKKENKDGKDNTRNSTIHVQNCTKYNKNKLINEIFSKRQQACLEQSQCADFVASQKKTKKKTSQIALFYCAGAMHFWRYPSETNRTALFNRDKVPFQNCSRFCIFQSKTESKAFCL